MRTEREFEGINNIQQALIEFLSNRIDSVFTLADEIEAVTSLTTLLREDEELNDE